jgi:hypothetical protein
MVLAMVGNCDMSHEWVTLGQFKFKHRYPSLIGEVYTTSFIILTTLGSQDSYGLVVLI